MAKIDDAMVDRALSAGRWERSCHTRKRMLESLKAALNPPAEPEIEVSREQYEAGCTQFHNMIRDHNSGWAVLNIVIEIYRAMARLAPKDAPSGTCSWCLSPCQSEACSRLYGSGRVHHRHHALRYYALAPSQHERMGNPGWSAIRQCFM